MTPVAYIPRLSALYTQVMVTSGAYNNTNGRIDVDAASEVRGQEGDVHIPLGNNCSRFSINLIDIILCSSDKGVLYAVIKSIKERL